MSSKSHRAKALAAQLEAGPSTSAGELVPPPSLVKPKVKKVKSAKEGVVGNGKGKGKSLDHLEEETQAARQPLGQEVDEDVAVVAARDVEMIQDGTHSMEAINDDGDDADMLIDSAPAGESSEASGSNTAYKTTSSDFQPISQAAQNKQLLKEEERRVAVPAHRMAPLKKEWVNIYGPLVEMMGLKVRMNVKKRCVEMKVSCRCEQNTGCTEIADTTYMSLGLLDGYTIWLVFSVPRAFGRSVFMLDATVALMLTALFLFHRLG
jgi:hypothetical protein